MGRVLVVEDDAGVAEMLRRNLAYEGYGVDVARDGPSGLVRVRDHPPDVVILDVMLPGYDGFEVLRRLRTAGDDTPVLMLTARDGVGDRVRGLEGGADDYLVKPFAVREMLARINALLRRRVGGERETLRYADLEMDLVGRRAARRGLPIDLSATEFDLLAHFLRHPEEVLSRDQIMERVWGQDFAGESNVIEVYVGYLRRKLEAGGATRLIQTVRGVGYVLREARAVA